MGIRKLTQEEREVIQELVAEGWNSTAIARKLGRSCSTITRERARNAGEDHGYSASKAQELYGKRKKKRKRKPLYENEELVQYIYDKLAAQWSPVQISNQLPIDFPDDPKMRASYESIYQWMQEVPKLKRFAKGSRRRRVKVM